MSTQVAVAVGWTTDSIGDTDAVRWDGTRPTSLASGSGAPSISLATAVNDAGTIVGRGDFGTAPFRRALRWQGTTRSTLRTLGGGSDAATGISESGLVTGGSLSPVDSKFHAVVWQGNTITDLGLFATNPTSGYGVNDCGTVVGDSVVDVGQDIIDAVIWQNGGPAVLIGVAAPRRSWLGPAHCSGDQQCRTGSRLRVPFEHERVAVVLAHPGVLNRGYDSEVGLTEPGITATSLGSRVCV